MIITTDKRQKTLAGEVSIKGSGLHTGKDVELKILPAEAHNGIVFRRIDLDNTPEIKVTVNNVSTANRNTILKQNNAEIETCEHLLAAFVGLEVDNAVVEINSSELPILDGSSQPFIEAIEKVGIVEQTAFVQEFVVNETITVKNEETGGEIMILPSDTYQLSVMTDYGDSVVGSQSATLTDITNFKNEIASARTFCFLSELEALIDAGLAKGGTLNNAIVYVDKEISENSAKKLEATFNVDNITVHAPGILDNVTLRYNNEAARHKLLDVIGDLYLAGIKIRGHVIAKKPGHKLNAELAKKIRNVVASEKSNNTFHFDLSKPVELDVIDIMKRLPHRPPFLLIDRIYEISDNHVIGSKSVTMNEPFFVGHFPGEPIMPGVLQIEAMAQVGGILVLGTVPDPENYLTFFLKINNVRFKSKVVPGDTIVFHLKLLTPIRRGICHMQGYGYVNNKLCSEAELLAQIAKVKN